MRGDRVIVRAFGGRPFVRRVWEVYEKFVLITDDAQYALLDSKQDAIEPLGCPREDVFKYDPKLAGSIEGLHKRGKWDWNKLVPF